MKVILASSNLGKIREFKAILLDFPIELITLAELEDVPTIDESGKTFTENALIKASVIANSFQQLTIADDSGLEVPALDNEPGIYSARYAKRQGLIANDVFNKKEIDHANNEALLRRMAGLPQKDRQAFFRCVIAIVDPANNRQETVSGSLEGVITKTGRGSEGFGYDPIFELPDKKLTLSEISLEEKNLISHRARALAAMKEIIPGFLE